MPPKVYEYKERFIAVFDFGLITHVRPGDPSWIQDVSDILNDVAEDVVGKIDHLGFGWRNNGFAIHTRGSSNEDFYLICTQICGVATRFFSLGLPLQGSLAWGLLFEEGARAPSVQFGPAADRANKLLSLNLLPRIVIDPDIPIRGMEDQILCDTQDYLDVLDPAFLSDYWALHHRAALWSHGTKFDVENTLALLASLEAESAPILRQPYSWLRKFIARPRP